MWTSGRNSNVLWKEGCCSCGVERLHLTNRVNLQNSELGLWKLLEIFFLFPLTQVFAARILIKTGLTNCLWIPKTEWIEVHLPVQIASLTRAFCDQRSEEGLGSSMTRKSKPATWAFCRQLLSLWTGSTQSTNDGVTAALVMCTLGQAFKMHCNMIYV